VSERTLCMRVIYRKKSTEIGKIKNENRKVKMRRIGKSKEK